MSKTTDTEYDAPPAKEIRDVRVEEEMAQSYIDYAMSVIVGRSLPGVRDGLKPVQRRSLYKMFEEGLTSNSSHRKSSSIVGETMGDYHPHGDKSIYDAIVRMAQDFSLRYPLIDGQGNFGSIDDDPPAAMRYTEARLSSIGEELLEDMGAETVNFTSNYDGRLEEPDVLPTRFPNLLVNGASGIAVGMSTSIPPHNLTEVVNATIHLIDNPNADVKELMEYVPGPDLPTGANIVGREGIYEAYKTGRGKIRVQSEYHIEEGNTDKIIITEIPYQTSKENLIGKIADMINDNRIEGVSDLRDESNRDDGIRIVLELKQNAVTKVVENRLVDSVLEKTIPIKNLAIVNGNPQVLSLPEILEEFIQHRREVVRRRSEYELAEKEQDAHILRGRITALENAEDIVDLIQDSEDTDEAIEKLMNNYTLSEQQAQHVTRMQLGSLTSMEKQSVVSELEQTEDRIDRLETILENEKELLNVIKDELEEIKEKYGDERRTTIKDSTADVTREDLIPEEDIIITATRDGYFKRMQVETTLTSHNRGGKGVIAGELNENDLFDIVVNGSTHDTYYCLSNKGVMYDLSGYQIPEYGRTAKGGAIVNFLNLDDDEEIVEILKKDENASFISIATKKGKVKKMDASHFESINAGGKIAIKIKQSDDEIVAADWVNNGDSIILSTKDGRSIRFSESDVRSVGRNAYGVNGIELRGSDVVTMTVVPEEKVQSTKLLTVTENGYGKLTEVSEYSMISRGGKGVIDIKTSDRNGAIADVKLCESENEGLLLLTEHGKIFRTICSQISTISRNSQGVKIMEVEENDRITSTSLIH